MKTIILGGKRVITLATFALILCVAEKTNAGLYQFGNGSSPNPVVPSAIQLGSSIDFEGNASLNGPIGTATAFTAITGLQGFANPTNPISQNASGSYAGVPAGTSVPFANFTFGGATPSSNFTLWSFNVGGTSYSFLVSTVTIAFQQAFPGGGGLLNLTGTGTAFIGSDSASATWSITDNSQNPAQPQVTFASAFATTSVPEPSEFALVAAAIVLIGVYRQFASKSVSARIK
jgi:hypothetical protein